MITQKLNEFKIANDIKSADKWAEACGVSKSTIVRALKGDHKDIGVYTLEQMIKPWNGSVDELLGIGAYSPESIAKEELKDEIIENIETVIEVIENSDEIPHETTVEIKAALEDVHDYVTNEPVDHSKCVVCATLRETIAELKQDKSTKDKWILNTFKVSFILLMALLVLIVANVILATCLINILS